MSVWGYDLDTRTWLPADLHHLEPRPETYHLGGASLLSAPKTIALSPSNMCKCQRSFQIQDLAPWTGWEEG